MAQHNGQWCYSAQAEAMVVAHTGGVGDGGCLQVRVGSRLRVAATVVGVGGDSGEMLGCGLGGAVRSWELVVDCYR